MPPLLFSDRRTMLIDNTIINSAAAGIGEKILQKYFRFLLTWPIGSLRVPVLMYHYISDNPNPGDKVRETLSVTPATFPAQIAYLAQHRYTSITPNTLYDIFQGQ